MVKFKKRSHRTKLICSSRDNPRKFWSQYKAITTTTRIPGVIKHESVQATRPIDQANFSLMLHVYPDSTTALNVNYLKYVLALATLVDSFNRLTLTKLPLVFPVRLLDCKHVLMKFHLRYADYSICPQSVGHFLKNGKTQILSVFINVSLTRWFQTTVVFRFLMFYLKFWKDKFIMRS